MLTDYTISRLSIPDKSCIHTYYDIPVESPDGRRIAFFAFDADVPGPGKVYISGMDGSDPEEVGRVTIGIGHTGGSVSWADNDRIAYSADPRLDHGSTVYSLSTGKTCQLTNQLRSMDAQGKHGVMLMELRNETEGVSSRQHLDLWDSERGEAAPFLEIYQAHALLDQSDQVDVSTLNFQNPKWSPDGKYMLVVLSNQWFRKKRNPGLKPPIHALFVLENATKNLFCLGRIGHHPMWMPHSQSIIAFDWDQHQNQRIIEYPIDRTGSRVMIDSIPGIHVVPDPSGRYLVLDMFDHPYPNQAAIVLLEIATGRLETLCTGQHHDFDHMTGSHPHPQFSRDGKRIYFNISDTKRPQLYALEINDRLIQ